MRLYFKKTYLNSLQCLRSVSSHFKIPNLNSESSTFENSGIQNIQTKIYSCWGVKLGKWTDQSQVDTTTN